MIGQTGEPFDVLKLEQKIVKAAKTVVKRDPNVGAILLECTELSAAAHAVQNAVRLPVYDYCTLIGFIQDGAVARQYTGWMESNGSLTWTLTPVSGNDSASTF